MEIDDVVESKAFIQIPHVELFVFIKHTVIFL